MKSRLLAHRSRSFHCRSSETRAFVVASNGDSLRRGWLAALFLTASLLAAWTRVAAASGPPAVSQHEEAHSAAATTPIPARAPKAVDAVAMDQALGWLKEGNARYVSGKTKGSARDPATRKGLTQGQHPYAIVLSCSDSRVPPELVFDQGLGQLFVVRVAGNVLGAATVASIEYAAEHLGSKLLVVMGHESCGAVKATLETPPTKSAGSVDLDTLVSAIRPNLEGYRKLASTSADPDAKTLRTPVKMNVSGVAARLLKRSKILHHLVETGKLKVVGGVYGLESGEVEFWDPK